MARPFPAPGERCCGPAAEAAAWVDATRSGPALTRAAAQAGAGANVWRPEALPEHLRRLSAIHFTAEWLRPHRSGVLPSPRLPDPVAELSAAGRPILLLHGERDMTFPAALAEQASSLIPTATAVVLPDAGQMAHIDDPAGWMAALRRFLL